MRTKTAGALAIFASCAFIGAAGAQDLGPQVKKLADGVYVHTGRGFESNSGIILTQDGVIVIDAEHARGTGGQDQGGGRDQEHRGGRAGTGVIYGRQV